MIAYDLRHIATSAADKDRTNWTVTGNAWTADRGGDLTHTLTGLPGGTGHDVQVRAVNAEGHGAWSPTAAGTPTTGTMAITGVHPGHAALTVAWDALGGAGPVEAYDLRYIASTADDESDANWTVVDNAWTPGAGPLLHVLTGLACASAPCTSYKVQARAVIAPSTDGAWSATATGTPIPHNHRRMTAATLMSGVPLGGVIESNRDALDFYTFTLESESELVLRTSGTLDTLIRLFDSPNPRTARFLAFNTESRMSEGENALIAGVFPAGTYHVEVDSYKIDATGSYTMHLDVFGDSTNASDAHRVELDGKAFGIVRGYDDADYFGFSLERSTDVVVWMRPGRLHTKTSGRGGQDGIWDTVATIRDAGGAEARPQRGDSCSPLTTRAISSYGNG